MKASSNPSTLSSLLAAAVCLGLGVAACSATSKDAASAAPVVSGTVAEGVVTATAKVKAIDQKTREVVLQREDGSVLKFKAGDEVRNLAQVKAGDDVSVAYYESLAYEVHKPGQAVAGTVVAEEAQRAALGDRPGASAARVTTMTATIAAIDKATRLVVLQTADGEQTSIRARDPQKLDKVAVGDLVEITYSEAIALSVQPAPKK